MPNVEARFLLICFTWSGVAKTKELEPTFNLALDWLRIAPNSWILWSNTDIAAWNDRVRKFMQPEDSVLIAELNMSSTPDKFSGFQHQWVWDWVQKAR